MHSFFWPPRQVKIGDAAAFVGITPRAIRHYHEIGPLPETARGGDDRHGYRYEDMIFGALGAAVQACRFIAPATHPALREESDRIDEAEAALQDSVTGDDPRVARMAAERHAFENAVIPRPSRSPTAIRRSLRR